jgi:hypothetical protein
MKPGRFSRFTAREIAEIRAARTQRIDALRRVKYLQSKYGLTSQKFSQVALGKVDGRKPRPETP